MTPTVAIFRFELGLPSEAFIPEQAAGLTRYTPEFWGREIAGQQWGTWPHHLADRWGAMASRLFSAVPSSQFFRDRRALKQANLMHAHFGPDATYALALAGPLKLPLIATYHGYDVLKDRSKLAQLGGLRVKYFFRHEEELKQHGAKYLAVSAHVERALLRHGYSADKIVQHYIGVDTARFVPLEKRDQDGQPPFILSVARHVEFKGIPTVLKAFAEFARTDRDVRLVQVGAGPLLNQHMALAKELGIADRVDFKGAVAHAVVRELMQRTLAFCGPSQTASDGGGEALGIVFCEASASGVPVLATRHGGIPEVVLDGETGILVDEMDAVALADGMRQIARDQSMRERLGMAGRARMVQYFNVKTQSKLLELIYDSVAV